MASSDDSGWVFGYGSLVWRPEFSFVERRAAFVRGYARRFWQGSPDHRGAPDAPGRVVTLVREAEAICWGIAFRIERDAWEGVLRDLDARESGGFERVSLTVRFGDPAKGSAQALTYVAGAENPNFLGPASLPDIAGQVRSSHGRSGSNAEYVLQLAASLRALDVHDDHVVELAALLTLEG